MIAVKCHIHGLFSQVFWEIKVRLVSLFEQQFSHFKHIYTYFHIPFHPYVFKETTKISSQTTLPNAT